MNLDYDVDTFRALLHQSADSVADLYAGLDSRRVVQQTDPAIVQALFEEPLPQTETAPDVLLERVASQVFDTATMSIGPNFFAYVQSGGTQIGILGDLLASALDQNCGKWHLSPSGVELELLVIKWISDFIGFRAAAGGVLTSGGSNANLICLATARRIMTPWDVSDEGLAGERPQLTAYVSEQGHYCLDKSLDVLGIGRRQLRKIPVTKQFTIDLDVLEKKIQEDLDRGSHPFCIIANGGTVNTGAVDPMNALADLCDTYNLWLHVDAAYGGPAAAVEAHQPLFEGLTRADSVAVDPHKWLYIPIEAGCALVRNRRVLQRTYSLLPDYLKTDAAETDRFDLFEHSFQLTRNMKALKIWMTFKAYGAAKIRDAIAHNMKLTRYLAGRVEEADDFERLAPVTLSILCFRYTGGGEARMDDAYLNDLNQRILIAIEKDGRVFLTGTVVHGRTALRVCLVNHRVELAHMDRLFTVIREIGSSLVAEDQPAGRVPSTTPEDGRRTELVHG